MYDVINEAVLKHTVSRAFLCYKRSSQEELPNIVQRQLKAPRLCVGSESR